MGAGVSNWRLARAVSSLGQLGVVSGTALDQILARRLQDGDPGGRMRHGLDQFPYPAMANRIRETYYVPGGKAERTPYKILPAPEKNSAREIKELCIVANFVEIFLAREGHSNPVGINYLEKLQFPHLASIYGAMLAGVGYILMGAGIPLKIPGVLDCFAEGKPATYPLHVTGATESHDTTMEFDPREFIECGVPPLNRPKFLAIVASNTLATTMMKKANGRVDGFVVEGPTAGGHNAPPRGKLQLDGGGEPIYGERDCVDIEKIRELGMPFWLAGGYGTPEKVREALDEGATGVQVGTAFAYTVESAFREDYKQAILKKVVAGTSRVVTNAQASPTSFPFKVAQLEGTLSDPEVYSERPRICDLGFLREPFITAEGTIDYRCPAEPESLYVAKGGKPENTVGKVCLCNALLAVIGHPQTRNCNHVEKGVVTSGNDLTGIARFMPPDGTTYTAADVIAKLLSGAPEKLDSCTNDVSAREPQPILV